MSQEEIGKEEILCVAATIEDPAAQAAYLDDTCGADLELRAEIESLLEYDRSAGDFLSLPDLKERRTFLKAMAGVEGPGTIIDRYQLLAKIGEGGMAVVYRAEQERPVHRQVALKIIKLGMDTKQVVARFEAERQALALMNHPNIARVFDGGATDTGRPYFVMELVQGVSITDYCDRSRLSVRERLELFIQVCQAVQHAHQKGIIHRDIKPSNIMVALRDDEAVPKIIDFGIAKATNQRLTEKTLFTCYAHIIGTPAYMSPEQAEMTDVDIDTRSDIYSLGVLLYELLTGATPFGREQLRQAGYSEMRRIIREEEPAQPSAKLIALGTKLPQIAQRRGVTPEALRRLVRGDLDWIVMKALAKARSERYETAGMLAMDIRRHLDHEPVLARRPSTIYRLQKFCRRHRVKGVALLVLAIVVSTAGTIAVMSYRDQRRFAESVLSQAREAHARGQHDTAMKQIAPILQNRHVGAKARLLHAGCLIDALRYAEAETELERLVENRPEIAGAAYSLWARMLWESGPLDAETVQQIKAYQQKAADLLPQTAEAHFIRAMTALSIGEKLGLLGRALQFDPQHYESYRMRAFTHYASRRYHRMRDDAFAMTLLRPKNPLGHSLRATALHQLGDFPEALVELDKALAKTIGDDEERIPLISRRGAALMRLGRYEQVLAEARIALAHAPDATALHAQVFCALTALGRYAEARTVTVDMLARRNRSDDAVQLRAMKHVFDTVERGQRWHPPGREPEGPAFFYMHEAEQMHRELRPKARRLITRGFAPSFSPDGTKVAFAQGLPGYTGVAVYDLHSDKTTLLTAPGKDPVFSPDGKYIAFVRDAPAMRLAEMTTDRRRDRTEGYKRNEEIWLMNADGTDPRRLVRQAHCPSWSADGRHVYFHLCYDYKPQGVVKLPGRALYALAIDEPGADPVPVCPCTSEFPDITPRGDCVADLHGGSERGAVLRILDTATQTCIDEWVTPLESPTATWAPDGREVSLGGHNGIRARTGLWIYDRDKRQGVKVLNGHFRAAAWSRDRTKLLIPIGKPYWEIWVADLDPALPTAESLGPVQSLEEHCAEMIATCTRGLEADPDSYVERWMRVTSALWIGDPRASDYLEDLDRRLSRPPFRRSTLNDISARNILAHDVLRERLGELAWVLACNAARQHPRHADGLAPLFEEIGWHEHAARLREIGCADRLKGSCQYDRNSQTYTLVGYGAGIAEATDDFHYAYKSLSGDGSITARVASLEAAPPRTKVGLMIRAFLDPGAKFAAVFATPSAGVTFHTRPVADRNSSTDELTATARQTAQRCPLWIRLERQGHRFSASYSPDGATWTPLAGSPQEITMSRGVHVGLAVTSHDPERPATVQLSQVATTGDVGYFQHFRESQDIRLQNPTPDPNHQ